VNERKDPKSVKIIVKYLHDDKGRECGVRGIITDVTVASDLARELRHQATHDPLTGLVNRAEFERRLNKALASFLDRMEPSVVLLLDLDRFKAVNDTCGHLAGDELLKQLSVLIGQQVRHGDVVARIGGDEFALLLTRCTIDDGAIVAEKIRAAVEKYRYVWHGESYAVGASIGAAQMENSFKNGEEVMRAADACCYKSKQEGRNRVSLYRLGDELVSSNHGEMMWLTQINQGLEENRFEIYKQPIVPVQDDAPGGEHFEVLLRLRGRDGVMLSPGEFLPAAERYGLMGSIDRWVVGKIVPWVAGRIANGATNLTVSVNLSGASASDPEFQAFLVETLGENFEATAGLCFEITESAAVKNLAGTADFLTLVQEMGCRIALDDFGTGFASMDYIKHLPLDYIKIDGAFIKNISDSPLDRALVQCVASVGRLLNVKTVGEFVESAQTIETLREVGIDYAQGYFTGKPEPLNTDDMQVNTAEVA
ncbi:MAG: EAL domain-containing protein, partial [Burkholderiaceae bacterium]